jgi:hypothetical protein
MEPRSIRASGLACSASARRGRRGCERRGLVVGGRAALLCRRTTTRRGGGGGGRRGRSTGRVQHGAAGAAAGERGPRARAAGGGRRRGRSAGEGDRRGAQQGKAATAAEERTNGAGSSEREKEKEQRRRRARGFKNLIFGGRDTRQSKITLLSAAPTETAQN